MGNKDGRQGSGPSPEHTGFDNLRAEPPATNARALRANVRYHPRAHRRDGQPHRRSREVHWGPDAAGWRRGERLTMKASPPLQSHRQCDPGCVSGGVWDKRHTYTMLKAPAWGKERCWILLLALEQAKAVVLF